MFCLFYYVFYQVAKRAKRKLLPQYMQLTLAFQSIKLYKELTALKKFLYNLKCPAA